MKLKGIELNGTYKVEFKDMWFEVYNDKGYVIYYENSNGYWSKIEYDERDNLIYVENSNGYWSKREYDKRDNLIYVENSNGYWSKSEYDKRDNQIYYENRNGKIVDNRLKELTDDDGEMMGISLYRYFKDKEGGRR